MHPPVSTQSPQPFTRNTAYAAVERASESLGVLWNVDLTFMRPKIIFVRLYGVTARDIRYVLTFMHYFMCSFFVSFS